jgi:hypothetical protein
MTKLKTRIASPEPPEGRKDMFAALKRLLAKAQREVREMQR